MKIPDLLSEKTSREEYFRLKTDRILVPWKEKSRKKKIHYLDVSKL